MAYDLGATVGLAVDVKDASGTLTNASTVILTITKPDGTTETPTVTNPPASTGHYVYDYVPTVAGRYVARWVFTAPATAYTDTFEVREADPGFILSLADAKAHLNIPATRTTNDEEVRDHLGAITDYIESKVGPVVRRTYTDVCNPYGWASNTLVTNHRQVLSVTSLTVIRDGSTPVTLADIDIDSRRGILFLKTGYFPTERFRLVYVCGRQIVPSSITLAARMLLKYTWGSQRGPMVGTSPLPTPQELLAVHENIPPRAEFLLETEAQRTGFA